MDIDFQKLGAALVNIFTAVVGLAAVLGWAIGAEYVQHVSDRILAIFGALATSSAFLPGLWKALTGDE